MSARWPSTLALLLIAGRLACGYMVGPPLSLDQMTAKSDLIFQGQVMSDRTIDNDAAFAAVPGFIVQETEFSSLSIAKGAQPLPTIKVRHYARDPNPSHSFMEYSPQVYEFEKDKRYLVFARHNPADPVDIFEQPWMNHTGMADEGAFLSAEPVRFSRNSSIKDIVWRDLTELLKASDPKAVAYAIEHLDSFSGGTAYPRHSFDSLQEYERTDALAVAHSFVNSSEPVVAQAALRMVGSHNPYMSQERAPFWLATIGSAKTIGLVGMDPKMINVGGMIYWRELVAVADSKVDTATRALAILALGLVREPSLTDPLQRWLADPAPEIRAAATILLADFPTLATSARLQALAHDPDASVRIGTALAVGFGQNIAGIPVADSLLKDTDNKVRMYAAMNLLSFAPATPELAALFRSHLQDAEFGPLFLVALARVDPAAWLKPLMPLASQDEMAPTPSNWWGGTAPAYEARQILFAYLKSRPIDELNSGRDDDLLTVMEKDLTQDVANKYAFYVNRHMTARAASYRARVQKASTHFDYTQTFDQVDRVPDAYR